MENLEELVEQTDTTSSQDALLIREAVKASSNLLATNDPLVASRISGALSILAIASTIKDTRHSYRLLNTARNIITRSLHID